MKYWFMLVLFLPFIACDTGFNYRGDGEVDSGLIIYPTFRVVYPEIALTQRKRVIYKFQHAPQVDLTLRLVLSNSKGKKSFTWKETEEIFETLKNADVKIKTELLSEGRLQRFTVFGKLINTWTFASFGDVYYFWNKKFFDFKVDRNIEYDLIIEIESVFQSFSSIVLVPIIEGGGFGKGDIYRPF